MGLGAAPRRRVMMVNFLIVDVPSSYNVVFRRPILNLFLAMVSTFHKKMKFPVRDDYGEVKGDQYQKPKVSEEGLEQAKMQVDEKLKNIELYLDRTGFATRIGNQMGPQVLRKNADIFTFSPADMVGIPPEVAM
ncbi:hypothetical protein ACS0TY_010210 [Phlomoides rotata]